MGNTIYASFNDPSLAEKAAGALLDHGVRPEDISVVRSQDGSIETTHYGTNSTYATSDGDNDLKNAGDAAYGGAHVAGHKVAEMGDRAAGAVADAFGADRAAANYRAAADVQDFKADRDAHAARGEFNDAIDAPSETGLYSNTPPAATIGSETRAWDPDPTSASRNDVVDASGDTEASAKHGISTTTSADAGAGALKGTAWGAGIGAVAALASVLVPGFGLVLGGGALAAAIGGFAATTGAGAIAGAVTGYLKDQGVDEHIAEHYDNAIAGGGALLAVTVPSGDVSEEEANMLLNKYGATNVNAYASKGYLA